MSDLPNKLREAAEALLGTGITFPSKELLEEAAQRIEDLELNLKLKECPNCKKILEKAQRTIRQLEDQYLETMEAGFEEAYKMVLAARSKVPPPIRYAE